MKNLNEYLDNSTTARMINESRFEVDECRADGDMKFGFMRYDDNRATVEVIQFNKLKDFAKFEGFGEEWEEVYMDIDKLDVGESVYDGSSYIYTRIW